jgi:hypothetical protein
MAKFTLEIMDDGDDEPVRIITLQADDALRAKSDADAAFLKVREGYPNATYLHLADSSGHSWRRDIAAVPEAAWLDASAR